MVYLLNFWSAILVFVLFKQVRVHCLEDGNLDCHIEEDNLKIIKNGEINRMGCNFCRCKTGRLICTGLLCDSSHSTKIEEFTGDTAQSSLTPCQLCDYETNDQSLICGMNLLTYRSFCHAKFCGKLDLDEVDYGSCEAYDFCRKKGICGENEACVKKKAGSCLWRDARECKGFKCVKTDYDLCMKELAEKQIVCGVDGVTYDNECELHDTGVAMAYYGPCSSQGSQKACSVDNTQISSIEWASQHLIPIDYMGDCIAMVKHSKDSIHTAGNVFNHRNDHCQLVAQQMRCPKISVTCTTKVIPEGMCCPICGAALTLAIDITIIKDSKWHDLSSRMIHTSDLVTELLKLISNKDEFSENCSLEGAELQNGDITLIAKGRSENKRCDVCRETLEKLKDILNLSQPMKSKKMINFIQHLIIAAVLVN